VYAITVCRNRIIAVSRFAVYRNFDTVDTALAKLKVNVVALIAANP